MTSAETIRRQFASKFAELDARTAANLFALNTLTATRAEYAATAAQIKRERDAANADALRNYNAQAWRGYLG